jgi:BldD-like DNA-binding protein
MKRTVKVMFVLGGVAGGLWVATRVLKARRRKEPEEPFFERRSDPDPDAMKAMSNGNFDRLGLDVSKLKELEASGYKPLVQYLTAIQVKRGEQGETLLFVRQRDLDALAELSGDSPDGFVKNFRELGILMSMN